MTREYSCHLCLSLMSNSILRTMSSVILFMEINVECSHDFQVYMYRTATSSRMLVIQIALTVMPFPRRTM